MPPGFTLPVVLVVAGALLVLAVSILLLAGIERSTARSFVNRQQAELAARAGLEDICGILRQEAANDDFLVLQSTLATPVTPGRDPVPMLFLTRGTAKDNGYTYHYLPLFSTLGRATENSRLAPPEIVPLLGTNENARIDFTTLIYQDKVRAAWLPIEDAHGRTIARYAYWVEDLQGKLDPGLVGNLEGPGQTHARERQPFPAPGLDDPASGPREEPPLNQVALFAIDHATTDVQQGTLGKTLHDNRKLLVSPESLLASAGITAPITRDASGHQTDPTARAAEETLAANLQPYFERPVIPFVPGILPEAAGNPRKNLNALLARNPHDAVDEMAGFIRSALPDFDNRKGGFPATDDYLKTLAANVIDYADADSSPTLKTDEYRGLDAIPLMSEIALQIHYKGISNQQDRKIMGFRFKLFAELFNPTNQPVTGTAKLSYEVALPMDSIGSGTGGIPFDSPELLDDPARSSHQLTRMGNRYWSQAVDVSLAPNQYRCYDFTGVSYRIDVGSSADWIPSSTPFSLDETRGASGISLMWNGDVVDRAESIVRQEGLVYSVRKNKDGITETIGGFKVGEEKTSTKAALPGHVYDNYWPSMIYNMGDPRITCYLRNAPLAENAYPQNISPNRRNIRREIYMNDAAAKPKVYARVLPSEWPDGGHNSTVGSWSPGTSDKTEMTHPKFDFACDPQMIFSAPQIISNRGRFFSTTELGRAFDPIMYSPEFENDDATRNLLVKGLIPPGVRWPDAMPGRNSPYYGGGNTLRIGRPEHPAFGTAGERGRHAARLLDLFHAGLSLADDPAARQGPVVRIKGHININTASRDTLRAMAAGALVMDPLLAAQIQTAHDATMMPPVRPLVLSAPTADIEADRIADAVIRGRPYGSAADLADASEADGTLVFGNRKLYPENDTIEWTDSATEEVFARVFEAATVRSRNFRVWVVAQALAPGSDPHGKPEVLAEVRKTFGLFADPGERNPNGSIHPAKFKTTLISTNEF